MFKQAADYIQSVRSEMGKVTWPTRAGLIESTSVTLMLSIILAIFVFSADFVISRFIQLII
ncbi:preprotein translocase subunit SecE [bacterium BMS3Bbin04]|nr:preprotein translocase subunit SecE [bacterium BMS3Bbin04]